MSDHNILTTVWSYEHAKIRHINSVALGWALILIAFALNLRAGCELGMLFAILSMAVAWGLESFNPKRRGLPVVWSVGALVTSYATWVAGWAFR